MLIRKTPVRAFLLLPLTLMPLAGELTAQEDAPSVAMPIGEQWKTDVFPISFWCGPPPEFVTVQRYRQIKDAGFTHVMPNCLVSGTIEENAKVLDTAEAAGLGAFVHDLSMPIGVPDEATRQRVHEIAARYVGHPAMAGYFLVDEPGADAFPDLAQTVAALREADPDHIAYINILPNYAPPDAMGTPTYEEHVERFLEVVRPAVLSYDHYSFLRRSDRPGFFENLEIIRRQAATHQVPFWQIVLLIDHHRVYRRPSEEEKRWEVMQTLAYGGKGVMYFTYWQPAATREWGEAIIDFDGTPTAQYDEVKRINRDVQTLGKYLLPATSTNVFQGGESDAIGSGCDLLRFEGTHLTVGVFEHGRTCYALFTNRDYRNARAVDVELSTGGARLEMLDKTRDEWRPAGRAGADVLDLRVELAPGDGELYRWTAK